MENDKQYIGLYYSRKDKFNVILVQWRKDLLGMFNRNVGQGGRQSIEYQNMYNVVISAVNGGDMTSEKLAQYPHKKLSVSYWQINRGHLFWWDMEDMYRKGWMNVNSKVTENSIK